MLKRVFASCFMTCAMIGWATACSASDGVDRLEIGDLEVLVIPDADVTMEKSLLPGLDAHPEMLPLFEHGPLPAVDRAYFLKSGGHNILIDTGWGADGKIKGKTLELLKAEGIRPEDVTDVILTHMDIDHVGGLLKDGNPVFPSAALWVSQPEFDAWNSGNIEKRPQNSKDLSKDILAKYGDRVKTFSFGDEILPGITAVDAAGHTPGHTAYQIKSGDEKLTIVGDLIHIAQVQLPLPELSTVYDVDMEKAAATRSRILGQAAEEGGELAGMHMPMISPVLKRQDHGFMMREPR